MQNGAVSFIMWEAAGVCAVIRAGAWNGIEGKALEQGGKELHMTTEKERWILVVDDEADIRSLLRILLEEEGYRVLEAADGHEAVETVTARAGEISLAILDILMPGMDGFETAEKLRGLTDAPILFLTACSSDEDKSRAYGSGGDDFVNKPFHAVDLRLKVKALIHRYEMYRSRDGGMTEGEKETCVRFSGGIEWHPEEKLLLREGKPVVLTEREYRLFACLAHSRGKNLTPATLYESVWGEPYLSSSSNTVIVHIANLRRKLEKDSSSPTLIRTVWGKGYRID